MFRRITYANICFYKKTGKTVMKTLKVVHKIVQTVTIKKKIQSDKKKFLNGF